MDKEEIKKRIESLMEEATQEIFKLNPSLTIQSIFSKSDSERLELYKELIRDNPYWKTKFKELGKIAIQAGLNPLFPPEEEVSKKFALFYGFNGILEKKYSVIEGKTEEEIRARMLMIKTTVAWSIHKWEEFEKIIKQFVGTPNALIEVPFEDAMSILRVGQLNEFEKFIEAEMEEFGDKCIPGVCKPGDHKCGKEKLK